MDPAAQVTLLLVDLKNGDPQAIDRLIPIVYDELRRLAAHYLRDEHAAATLQPTVLVHEAYLTQLLSGLDPYGRKTAGESITAGAGISGGFRKGTAERCRSRGCGVRRLVPAAVCSLHLAP